MAVPSLDVLSFIPKEIRIIAAVAFFMYAGAFLIEAVKFLVNLAVGGINAVNGCMNALGQVVNPSVCIPWFQGIYVFGINFTDFWVITGIIFFPAMAFLAFKWYGIMLNKSGT